MGVYGELGRYPLYINRYVSIIKYWFKLLKTENIILQEVYILSNNDCDRGYTNWVSGVKKLLCEYGFSYVWNNPDNVNVNSFIALFKQKLIDCFLQNWHSAKETSGVLIVYNAIKPRFEYESYLSITILYYKITTIVTFIKDTYWQIR